MAFPWASTSNYPPAVGGVPPWGGTPTKVAPGYGYFTPGPNNAPAAQELNWLFWERDMAIATVATQVAALSVGNWNETSVNPGGSISSSVNAPTAACWESFGQRWLLACSSADPSVAATIQASMDGGKTWESFGPGLINPTYTGFAIGSNPSTGSIVLFQGDGTTTSVRRFTIPDHYHSADAVQGFLAGVDVGVVTYFGATFVFVGATGYGTSTWTGKCALSADGSGAWTDASSGLPTSFASGTDHVLQYVSAQSDQQLVIAKCGKTPGTDVSKLAVLQLGSGFTEITPSVLGGAAKAIRGIAFDTTNQLWSLLGQDASGNSYLWTSPDLTTWTLAKTFTGFWSAGLGVVGGVWAALVYNQLADEGGNRVVFSADLPLNGTTATWSFADTTDPDGMELSAIPDRAFAFLSSGDQLLRSTILGKGQSPGPVLAALSLRTAPVTAGFGTGIGGGGGGGGGGGATALFFEQSGAPILSSSTANFIGAIVTDVGGVATITIPSPPTTWQRNGVTVLLASTLNVVGAGVSLTNVGGVPTLSIPGAPSAQPWTSVSGNFTPTSERKITIDPSVAGTFTFPIPTGDGDSIEVQADGTKPFVHAPQLATTGGDKFGDPEGLGAAVTSGQISTPGKTWHWTYRLSDVTWLLEA